MAKRKPNKERQAQIIDKRNDRTKGEGLYVVEKGAQKGADASVRKMPEANGKNKDRKRPPKDKDVNGGKGTRPNDAKTKTPNNGGKAYLAKGVKYLMSKNPRMNRARALARAKANVKADRANRSYGGGFDWAKDGIGAKDRDMGTAANNAARKRMGAKKKITVRANVKNASKMGTGKVLIKKPEMKR